MNFKKDLNYSHESQNHLLEWNKKAIMKEMRLLYSENLQFNKGTNTLSQSKILD